MSLQSTKKGSGVMVIPCLYSVPSLRVETESSSTKKMVWSPE